MKEINTFNVDVVTEFTTSGSPLTFAKNNQRQEMVQHFVQSNCSLMDLAYLQVPASEDNNYQKIEIKIRLAFIKSSKQPTESH